MVQPATELRWPVLFLKREKAKREGAHMNTPGQGPEGDQR